MFEALWQVFYCEKVDLKLMVDNHKKFKEHVAPKVEKKIMTLKTQIFIVQQIGYELYVPHLKLIVLLQDKWNQGISLTLKSIVSRLILIQALIVKNEGIIQMFHGDTNMCRSKTNGVSNVFQSWLYLQSLFKDAFTCAQRCDHCPCPINISKRNEMP